MPQLLLNEDSTLLCIEIKKYHPTKEMHDDWDWCDIHIKIKNSYIDFDETNEFLTNWEVEWISRYLRDIVEKGYESSEEESFTEPEINFSTEDGALDIIIEFCSNGCYCGERWSTGLTEEETKEFYEQWLAEMQECANETNELVSAEKKTADHLTNKCGIEVTPSEVKEINDKITANISVKNGVLNISSSSKTNVDKVLNESEEFKEEMNRIKATGKNMCAFVSFYKNGGGKTYTYLVDAYYHGGRWFVEDTDKEVYVMEFGELSDEELPVRKDKMKHLRWEGDTSPSKKESSNKADKEELPIHILVYKEALNDAFERAEIYLDNKFPDFNKSLIPDILGDFYYYVYRKDDKMFKLCMDVWPTNAVWIDSNFEFETPDFENEKIYVKEIGELTIEQQKELALIYYIKYPDFQFKKTTPIDLIFSNKTRTDYWLCNSNYFIKIRSKEENDKSITCVESNIDIDIPTMEQIEKARYISSFTYTENARKIDKETERNLEKVDGALNVDLDMGVITILNILSIDLTKEEIDELKNFAKARDFFIDGDLITKYEGDNFERIYNYKESSWFEDEGCLYFKGNSEGLTTVLPIRGFVINDSLFWVDLMRKCVEIIRRHFTPYVFSKFTKEEREIIKFHIGLYTF